jgi:N6-L-threonylcarbamoyladenine synthase
MKILGIETSCDETAVSIIDGSKNKIKVLSNIVSSQIDIHKKYGGVVPEVAAREHVLNILPVINEAFKKAGVKKQDAKKEIKAIAVAQGPGLVTSLLTGIETAKTLSYAWDLPIIPVNHIEGHIYSNFIEKPLTQKAFPALALTVSGGHTMLVLMHDHGKYRTIGETRDDAAGEAFDKAAKLMGIGYPGGPIISKEATKFKDIKNKSLELPRPMLNSPNFDFSFSGLKTAIRYEIEKDKNYKKRIPEYCYEFQQAVIDCLIHKTIKAARKFGVKSILLSGGVSANKELRLQLKNKIKKELPEIDFQVPDLKYTTDNAVMIAAAGYYKFKNNKNTNWKKIKVDCNLEL